MTIYEAPFLGKAKPIKTIAPKKKAPAKKNVDTEAATTEKPKPKPRAKKPAAPVTPPPSDVPDDSNVEVAESNEPEKPKPKPRKRKAQEGVEEESPKPPPKKKASPKVPKAKPEGEEAKTSKAKGKKVIIDGETAEKPPTWIKQFVGDISKQINALKPKEEKKPAAEVKEDAEKLVEKKWSDPEFQKKMERKQKAYVSSIYQQIWGNSKIHMQDV